MSKFRMDDERVFVDPPSRPKRMTGTRFAAVLNMDRWNTPFKVWCALTRTYEEPFIENQYTRAGKAIEPLIIEYLNDLYFFGELVSPVDIYGPDPFKKTWGNFFPEQTVFGGMWDAIHVVDGETVGVVEIKTTKRVEDWENGAPLHHSLQAALYAWLLGTDQVTMVGAFLTDADYAHPEKFVPSATNTAVDQFKLYERFPDFDEKIQEALSWWDRYVVTGESPPFDPKTDKETLDGLTTNAVTVDDDISVTLTRLEKAKAIVDANKEAEKEYKDLAAAVRDYAMAKFGEHDTKVVLEGPEYEWTLSKSLSTTIDRDLLQEEGLLEKFSNTRVSYRFNAKKKE